MDSTKEFLHEDIDGVSNDNSEMSFALHVISDSEDSEATLSPVMPADCLAGLNHEQVSYRASYNFSYLVRLHALQGCS